MSASHSAYYAESILHDERKKKKRGMGNIQRRVPQVENLLLSYLLRLEQML